MVGVVDAAAEMEHGLRVRAEDRVGLERADLADQHLAQGEVIRQRAVGLVQERDAGVADDGRRSTLRARSAWGILAPVVAGGAAPEPAGGTAVDPRGRRAGRSEVRVVGMGGDDHEAIRPPIVGLPRGLGVSHPSPAAGCMSAATRVARRATLLAARMACAYALRPRLRSSPPTSA